MAKDWSQAALDGDLGGQVQYIAQLEAALAAERERCAKIAESFTDYTGCGSEDENSLIGMFARGNRSARRRIAAAIRKSSS